MVKLQLFCFTHTTEIKARGFFHHKGFLKEILSLRYRVFVKLRSNRYKIILFDFHLLQKRYMDHFESQLCDQTEFGKKVEISDHFTASHKMFCFPFFSCFFKGSIEISSLKVAFALLLRKKPSETIFPHRLNYGGNYKIFILPIVQKTARKKNIHNF